MTVAQLLKHDFKSKGSLHLYNNNGREIYQEFSTGYWSKRVYNDNCNIIYYENSYGYWDKREFGANGNRTYYEDSYGYWYKQEFDTNGKLIYYENSKGEIIDNRPKKKTCKGKVVEIDGKKYKLSEV